MAKLILNYNLFQVKINVVRRENIARNLPILFRISFKGGRARLRAGRGCKSPRAG